MTILHLYSDLMNLYGDWANVAMVRRTLEAMGHAVTVNTVNVGDDISFDDVDFLYMGAGTESAAAFVTEQLRPVTADLRLAMQTGMPMVFCGTALDVLGKSVVDQAGRTTPALGLLPFIVHHGSRRVVGDVVGQSTLAEEAVVGYRNSCSLLSNVETPFLATLSVGDGLSDGFRQGNAIGTQLTGPLLVKNPAILRWLVSTMCKRRSLPCDDIPLDENALAGHKITLEQLQK